jgi:hypothetical protein
MNKPEIKKAIGILRGDKEAFVQVNHGGFDGKIKAFELAISALEYQLTNGWIPVSERLPEDFIKVLTCDKEGNIHITNHCHEYEYPFGISENHPRYYMPVAWQPLPEPYKEETE